MYTNICCLNDMREDFRKDFYFNVRSNCVCLLIGRRTLYDTFSPLYVGFCKSVRVYSKSCKQRRMLAPYRKCTRFCCRGLYYTQCMNDVYYTDDCMRVRALVFATCEGLNSFYPTMNSTPVGIRMYTNTNVSGLVFGV